MKHFFKSITLFICLFISFNSKFNAQTYVTIPDANFVTWLQSHYPICMNGNQMDISCSWIQNEWYVDVQNLYIADLTGIEHFINLTTLNCSNNQLTSLPVLPESLTTLYIGSNQLTSLPILPPSLITLDCSVNQLTNLPNLPTSLYRISCSYNNLISLPSLPNSLNYVVCRNNPLTSLPALPSSLRELLCNNCQLTSLPVLPDTLTVLWCYFNQLTSLPEFPTLYPFSLSCNNNQLTSLNTNASSINCSYNQLTTLELDSPFSYLDCSYNLLTSLDLRNFSLGNEVYLSYNNLTHLFAKNGFGNQYFIIQLEGNTNLQYDGRDTFFKCGKS